MRRLKAIAGDWRLASWLLSVLVLLAVAGMAAFLYLGPQRAGTSLAGERFKIVVVYPDDASSKQFLAGIRMAIDEVNAGNGLAGAYLDAVYVPEERFTDRMKLSNVVERTLALAGRVARDPEVTAVIGHGYSATAVPAGAVYNREGKLFLATHATATSLSNLQFSNMFALQPNNADIARVMAHFAMTQGMRRFVVLSDSSGYGMETTKLFRSFVSQEGGEILYRGALSAEGRSIDDLLLFILENDLFAASDVDAFFITTNSMEDAGYFIRRARTLGLSMPILGPENLFAGVIEDMAGLENMHDVAAVSLYDEQSESPIARRFLTDFEARFGKRPDLLAAIGYDAIKLLDFVVDATGSRNVGTLSDKLRVMRYEVPYEGVTGRISFDSNGLITDTETFVIYHNGRSFETVAKYRKPFAWHGSSAPSDISRPSGIIKDYMR
ncbi:MAG: ABC transporter substrate-binding protein [Oceanibaculum sp.]